MEPTIPEEMFDAWEPEWRRKTWFGPGEFGLNPWNAPGSAPVYGNGCGVNGGNPDGCTGGGKGRIHLISLSYFRTKKAKKPKRPPLSGIVQKVTEGN